MVGITLEARGCEAPVGSRCLVVGPDGDTLETEVVGFGDERLYLMPLAGVHGVMPGSKVIPLAGGGDAGVGDALLGRIIDGAGVPLDDKGPIATNHRVSLKGHPINPLHRKPIERPLDVGVRAINGLLTIGEGQRMGLFAGSGVGKSTLLGLMTRSTQADVVVVGLIGERGREVKEFVDTILSEEGMARSVVVATPADSSPLMRIHGALRATAIAEYFRERGLRVLLLMDSLTRFAQAQREIAVSIGEFPVSKGYPPSVFTMLPQLIERAGNGSRGSITAIYTVLVEGDDHNDPIADASRAILDGHIVLSRRIADAGIYPAISVESSVSRSMSAVASKDQMAQSRLFKRMFALYEQNRDLIAVGAYAAG
ncbi:MAG: FliI/YscN family ATPase, partial [Pseudomonadales bacterium]|nr:FliI/YscN family ATPase [Pseudomonadales bacterium]